MIKIYLARLSYVILHKYDTIIHDMIKHDTVDMMCLICVVS
jgi:hypothetical protein